MTQSAIFVVISAFNEQDRLPEVLNQLTNYIPAKRIIIVDDGSPQPLRLPSKSAGWLLRHRINLGKGLAMKTGAEFAFSHGAEAIIFMDADGQHNPAELTNFTAKLLQGYDVVFGIRTEGHQAPAIRFIGNRVAALYLRIMFGISIADVLCGYRALTRHAYSLLRWDSARYGVETEMVARLAKHQQQLQWTEVPVETIYKDKYKGVTLVTAIKILGETLWWKLS